MLGEVQRTLSSQMNCRHPMQTEPVIDMPSRLAVGPKGYRSRKKMRCMKRSLKRGRVLLLTAAITALKPMLYSSPTLSRKQQLSAAIHGQKVLHRYPE